MTGAAAPPSDHGEGAGVSGPIPSSGPDTRGAIERRWSRQERMVRWASVLGIIGIWWLATSSGVVETRYLPSPADLVRHTWLLFTDGYRGTSLAIHLVASMRRTAIGFGLAVALGIPIGLAMGRYRILAAMFGPVLAFLRPIPPIAFIPLAVLYLGLGESAKIVLIFLAAFMFVVLNAEAGVRSVPAILIRAGETLGYSPRRLFTHIILPGSLPSVMSGVRVAAAVSWALVVAAELVAGQKGLGYMVASAGNFFDIRSVFVGILFIGVIGYLLDAGARTLERRLLHWQGR